MKTTLLLLIATCSVAFGAGAHVDKNLMRKLIAQTKEETLTTRGANAYRMDEKVIPELAWNEDKFNPDRMVKLTAEETYSLVGYSDPVQVQAQLGQGLKAVIQDFGNGVKGVPTFIAYTEGTSFVGCTCPPLFKEIKILVAVQSDRPMDEDGVTSSAIHISPLYFVTDHLKRQNSLVKKFDIAIQFAGIPRTKTEKPHIGLYRKNDQVKGFYLLDQDGKEVFSAKKLAGTIMKPVETPIDTDIFIHTSAQQLKLDGHKEFDLLNLDGANVKDTYIRVLEKSHHFGYSPAGPTPESQVFKAASDKVQMNTATGLGKVLAQIKYQPLAWSSDATYNGMLWFAPK